MSSFHSTGVQAYESMTKLRPCKLLDRATDNLKIQNSSVNALVERNVDGRNIFVLLYARTDGRNLDGLGFIFC